MIFALNYNNVYKEVCSLLILSGGKVKQIEHGK